MSESKAKPASPLPPAASIQCCNSLTDTVQCPALQVTSRMLRSPSHESVTTDLSLFSVSSIASELRGVNRLANFKSYTDIHLAGRGPSPKPDSRQVQTNRFVLFHYTDSLPKVSTWSFQKNDSNEVLERYEHFLPNTYFY